MACLTTSACTMLAKSFAHSNDSLSVGDLPKQINMQAALSPDDRPDYFNMGVSDTFSRASKALELTQKWRAQRS